MKGPHTCLKSVPTRRWLNMFKDRCFCWCCCCWWWWERWRRYWGLSWVRVGRGGEFYGWRRGNSRRHHWKPCWWWRSSCCRFSSRNFCQNSAWMKPFDDKYGPLWSRSRVEKSNVCQMSDASYEITTNDGVLGCVVSHQMQLPSVYFQAFHAHTHTHTHIHTKVHTKNTNTNSGMLHAYRENRGTYYKPTDAHRHVQKMCECKKWMKVKVKSEWKRKWK